MNVTEHVIWSLVVAGAVLCVRVEGEVLWQAQGIARLATFGGDECRCDFGIGVWCD